VRRAKQARNLLKLQQDFIAAPAWCYARSRG
jgi:hypothetical protein